MMRKYDKELTEDWCFIREGYDAGEEANQETVFTLANGYMGVRGSIELPSQKKCQGTYLAGVYDKPDAQNEAVVYGLTLKNKAITPAYAIVPDTNLLEIHTEGDGFDFMNGEVRKCRRILDMKHGVERNEYLIESRKGNLVEVHTFTMVSKVRKHIMMYGVEVTPVNFSGKITVKFCNRLCTNPQFIPRLKDYISKTDCAGLESIGQSVCLLGKVAETGTDICAMAQTAGKGRRYTEDAKDGICEVFEQELTKGDSAEFVKVTSLYSSRDTKNVKSACKDDLQAAIMAGKEVLLEEHCAYWEKQWRVSDVAIAGDPEMQLGIRWSIFQLIQLGSEEDADSSISATGLHGQGYFGHVFWDTEIFMLPFYLATNVKVARNLLMYRYNRLDEARKLAEEKGFKGAKFPWTSAFTGADVTPPDWERCASRQIHISGDVAFAFRNFYDQTKDKAFYQNFGAEVIVETAKFYASRAERDADGKYHILDVIGPDEYNIHADDNYYTNHMAVWNMKEAVRCMEELEMENAACFKRIAANTGWDGEMRTWLREVSEHMAFPQTREKVNEQYAGFFAQKDLGEIARDAYNMPLEKNYVYDGGTQVLKQADVVMMHYLFPGDFSEEVKRESFRYYEKRCLHGSSLSPAVHCIMGLRSGLGKYAYGYLYLTAMLDLKNLHLDKNVSEGLHAACAGGTWAAAVYGFGGVEICEGRLNVNPILPEKWTELKYVFRHKGILFDVWVRKNTFTVQSSADAEIYVDDKRYFLKASEGKAFDLGNASF